jgi:hypothetical protein
MAKDPVAAAPAAGPNPPVIVDKEGVVLQVRMAMTDEDEPTSITIQRIAKGKYSVAVKFD